MTRRRAERVADEVRQILARVLREELRDPRIGFATLTDVKLSQDLRYARVFVSFIGEDRAESLRVLNHATPFLRRALAQQAGLRFAPELRFEIDPSIEQGFRVDRILEEIADDETSAEDGSEEDR